MGVSGGVKGVKEKEKRKMGVISFELTMRVYGRIFKG
jgi:hypothetical protein